MDLSSEFFEKLAVEVFKKTNIRVTSIALEQWYKDDYILVSDNLIDIYDNGEFSGSSRFEILTEFVRVLDSRILTEYDGMTVREMVTLSRVNYYYIDNLYIYIAFYQNWEEDFL